MGKTKVNLYIADIDDEIKNKVELPRDFRSDWLRTLRSDKLGQTQNELTDGKNNYCCLGVACHVAGYNDYFMRNVDGITHTAKKANGDFHDFCGYIGYDMGFHLKKVPEVLHGSKGFPDKLAGFNDNGYSFKKIADFIQRNTIGV